MLFLFALSSIPIMLYCLYGHVRLHRPRSRRKFLVASHYHNRVVAAPSPEHITRAWTNSSGESSWEPRFLSWTAVGILYIACNLFACDMLSPRNVKTSSLIEAMFLFRAFGVGGETDGSLNRCDILCAWLGCHVDPLFTPLALKKKLSVARQCVRQSPGNSIVARMNLN